MSRALPAAERIPLDAYQTPLFLAAAICDRVYRMLPLSWRLAEIVEPSAGRGAFVVAARARWPGVRVIAVDIDPKNLATLQQAGAKVAIGDWVRIARHLRPAAGGRLVIGNPPYTYAEEHAGAALEAMADGDLLVFLLRINFLGSVERVGFWSRPGLVWMAPIAPRPSFTGGGTDGTEYAAFCWRKGYVGPATIAAPIVGPKGWKAPAAGRAA